MWLGAEQLFDGVGRLPCRQASTRLPNRSQIAARRNGRARGYEGKSSSHAAISVSGKRIVKVVGRCEVLDLGKVTDYGKYVA
jgi:hypothetical protein